jgi:endodeoxyribonuclease RusA
MIVLEVLGTPAPKGSGRAILIGGKARHVASGSDVNRDALRAWDGAIRAAAADAVGHVGAPPLVGVAIALAIEFRMARPGSHWGTGRHAGQLKPSAPRFPIGKPDSSKLLRATEDSLTGIVWDDDSRVSLHLVDRIYALPGREGATIVIASRDEMAGLRIDAVLAAASKAPGRAESWSSKQSSGYVPGDGPSEDRL